MTNEEFIKKRKEILDSRKHSNNLIVLKELLGEESFSKLPKEDYFVIRTDIQNRDGGTHYTVYLNSGKIDYDCDVAFIGNIYLPDEEFNEYFFEYCKKNNIF